MTRGQPTTDTQSAIRIQHTERRTPGGWISIAVPPCTPRLRLGPCAGMDEPWFFDAMLEGRLRLVQPRFYPRCLDGDFACPPYDFITPADYHLFLDIVGEPAHPLCDTLLRSCGFDPHAFDPNAATAAMQQHGSNGVESVEVEPSHEQWILNMVFSPQPPWFDDLLPEADEGCDGHPTCVLATTENHSETGNRTVAAHVEPHAAEGKRGGGNANGAAVAVAEGRSPPQSTN